ncbi:MAG: ABC transporter ATP-binding protein [Gaiellaceae bacterium]
MAEVRFESVSKLFGKVAAVDDVDLEVADGEFVVLLGPSGCGKTTLLRSLAGLEQIDAGRVWIGGRDATDLPPRRRRIAMVFQSYAVFPHMTVRDNIGFGLKMQKERSAEIKARVQSSAALLQIEDYLDRYPAQLSGGQRQRVAVARAIATKADVLLMDEPLSNLDALLRMEARAELKALLQKLGTTTIYVTHDQIEALSMGDRVAVMRAGRIVQLDTPLAVYDNPADMFVGGFIGTPPMNFLEAEISRNGGTPTAAVSGGSFALGAAEAGALAGRKLVLGIRAEAIGVESAPGEGLIRGTLVVLEPLGSHNLLTVRLGDDLIKVSAPPDFFRAPESDVWLRIEPGKIRWMDGETRSALDPAGTGAAREGAVLVGAEATTAAGTDLG